MSHESHRLFTGYMRRMWSPLKMKVAGETGDSFYILFDGEVRLCCQSDEVCIEYHHVYHQMWLRELSHKKIRRSTKSPCAVFMTENDGKNGLPGWFMTLLLSSDPALKHLPQNQTKWYDMNNIRSVHRVCTCMYSICFYLCMYLHRNHFSHDSCFFLMEFSSLSMCWDLILTVVVCMISSKDLCVFVAQESLSGPEHRTRFKWSSMATP